MTRLLARFRTKAATLQDWKAFVMVRVRLAGRAMCWFITRQPDCRVTHLTSLPSLSSPLAFQGLRHLLVIGHLVSGRRDDLSLFLSMHRLFDVELQDLLDLIERVIVLEEQPDAEQDQANLVRVRNGIDQKVSGLREGEVMSCMHRGCFLTPSACSPLTAG